MTTTNVILQELSVGTRSVFAAAGFSQVAQPTLRRVVMRIDFDRHEPDADPAPRSRPSVTRL